MRGGAQACRRHWRLLPAALLLLALSPPAQAQQKPQVKCDIGPVGKRFGGEQWLVYACDDDHTVVVISGPATPAAPYYFVFSPTGAGYKLIGDGSGAKAPAAAAMRDLQLLNSQQIEALRDEAKMRR